MSFLLDALEIELRDEWIISARFMGLETAMLDFHYCGMGSTCYVVFSSNYKSISCKVVGLL